MIRVDHPATDGFHTQTISHQLSRSSAGYSSYAMVYIHCNEYIAQSLTTSIEKCLIYRVQFYDSQGYEYRDFTLLDDLSSDESNSVSNLLDPEANPAKIVASASACVTSIRRVKHI